MLYYVLKTILIQFIGLGIYYAFLRNEQLFQYTRLFLCFVLGASFIIPAIPYSFFELFGFGETIGEISGTTLLSEIYIDVSTVGMQRSYNVVLLIYSLVTLVYLLRMIKAYSKLYFLKRKSQFQEPNVYLSDEIDLPFSFLNWIFIPNSFKTNDEMPFIMAHENAHIDMRHSWDKIFVNLLSSICWFNPLMKIFHRQLELIHEYQVDCMVVTNFSKDEYLNTLLQTTVYTKSNPICLAHSFFTSSIKNRIIMLHKKTKHPILRMSFSAIAIMTALFGTLSMNPSASTAQVVNQEEIHAPVPPPPPPPPPGQDIVKSASFPGGQQALVAYLKKNIKYPKHAKSSGTSAKLYVEFIVMPDGSIKETEVVNLAITDKKRRTKERTMVRSSPPSPPKVPDWITNEAIRVISTMPKWNPAIRADGTATKSKYTLPIFFEM